MSTKKFAVLGMIFAGICFLGGTATLVADKSIFHLYGKHGWLDSIVFTIAGEQRGKVIFAIFWYLVSAWTFSRALQIWNQKKEKNAGEATKIDD